MKRHPHLDLGALRYEGSRGARLRLASSSWGSSPSCSTIMACRIRLPCPSPRPDRQPLRVEMALPRPSRHPVRIRRPIPDPAIDESSPSDRGPRRRGAEPGVRAAEPPGSGARPQAPPPDGRALTGEEMARNRARSPPVVLHRRPRGRDAGRRRATASTARPSRPRPSGRPTATSSTRIDSPLPGDLAADALTARRIRSSRGGAGLRGRRAGR